MRCPFFPQKTCTHTLGAQGNERGGSGGSGGGGGGWKPRIRSIYLCTKPQLERVNMLWNEHHEIHFKNASLSALSSCAVLS